MFYEMKDGMPVEVDPTDAILTDKEVDLPEDEYPHEATSRETSFVDLCQIDPAEWQYW